MMAELEKPTLPKRHYYTLQQAADELNRYFKVENPANPIIDVDYLLHLGATGELQIYLLTFHEIEAVNPFNEEQAEKTIYIVNSMLNKNGGSFLRVHHARLSEVELLGGGVIYGDIELLIKRQDVPLEYRPRDREVELKEATGRMFHSIESEKKIDQESNQPKKIDPLSPIYKYPNDPYLPMSEVSREVNKICKEDAEGGIFLTFQIKQDVSNPDIRTGQFISKDSLYIFSYHLEVLKNPSSQSMSDMQEQIEKNNKQQTEIETKLHGKVENSHGMVVVALASLANLDLNQPHKAAEALTNHAESKGLTMPKNIKTTAARLTVKQTE